MKIFGYTTTRNCVNMGYPFIESIRSHLDFCDTVVVMDSSDKDDGTQDMLDNLVEELPEGRLEVYHTDVDYTAPNHAVWDGKLKAMSREQCKGADYLWQFDVDEAVKAGMRPLVEKFIADNFESKVTDKNIVLCSLPVVEFWGSKGKVRVDVNPWKWRLSRNLPHITHGIPINLRKREKVLGVEYDFAMQGTDGCDYIDKTTGHPIPCKHFLNSTIMEMKQAALQGNKKALEEYEFWFNKVTSELPSVYHYSWFSIPHKIRMWQKFWNKFWLSLYNELPNKGNMDWNPFFDQPLSAVTPTQVNTLGTILETYTGGHIFHTRWNFTTTPHVNINESNSPSQMEEWYHRNT